VDAYAAGAWKFLLGPYGTAVGLFSPALLARLAVGDLNWWSVKGSDDFDHLPRGGFELRPGAPRYDAHDAASFNNLMPLAESLRLVLEATPAAVQAHCREIGDRILERLPEGFRAASPLEPAARSHVLCIAARTPEATRAAHERLLAARVRVSLVGGRLRVGPHLHASTADADRLISALAPGT
jgi:selenocysteine lyase/cysteine desulfurase